MDHFIFNIIIFIWAFACWYIVGLGPALLLHPKGQKHSAYFLAPLLGMCLLILTGLFEISFLLIPLTPKINLLTLSIISLLITFSHYYLSAKQSYYDGFAQTKLNKNIMALTVIPFCLLFFFAWFFHGEGLELLVGSSDQLQYCLNAKQILLMHSQSPNDLPFIRMDHIIYDIVTRVQPYNKTWRRGAEIILATMSSLTNLSVQEAFSLVVLNALITLGLLLAILGRVFFNISLLACFLLQALFFSSFFIMLVHLQGSLALILGIPLTLTSLLMLFHIANKPRWQDLFLTALVIATYFTTYPEPSLINVICPTLMIIIWQFFQSRSQGLIYTRNIFIVYCLAYVFSPNSFIRVLINIQDIFSALLTFFEHSKLLSSITLQQWDVAPVILGATSYYDLSSINAKIGLLIVKHRSLNLLMFYGLITLSLIGYIKTKKPLALLFLIPLCLWTLASLFTAFQHDDLRFTRSLHYAMPFIFIGLVLLINIQFKHKKFALFNKFVFITFIILNISTSYRTIHYLMSHNTETDNIVLRFNEKTSTWQALKTELNYSATHNLPFLISGYQDTIKPLIIASATSSQPHVLGKSILSFWPLYDMRVFNPRFLLDTRLSEQELEYLRKQKNYYWPNGSHPEALMTAKAEQAIVPINNGYPQEWIDSKDIYAPLVKRVENFCDVVYRKKFAVSLEGVSPLQRDKNGPYRLLKKNARLIFAEQNSLPKKLVIEYEGSGNDLKFKIGNALYTFNIERHNKLNKAVANMTMKNASLIADKPVKLRSITLL